MNESRGQVSSRPQFVAFLVLAKDTSIPGVSSYGEGQLQHCGFSPTIRGVSSFGEGQVKFTVGWESNAAKFVSGFRRR